jgi:hypothetical protein
MLAMARVQAMLHQAAVSANWAAFHVGVPADFASYVYKYLDGAGELMYVGMTSNATWRAVRHWDRSDWVSWVASVKYTRCHSRDEAFKLETRIRNDEQPLFTRTRGNAALLAELNRLYPVNHVIGSCHCNMPELAREVLANNVIETGQTDPSGWM